MPVPKTIEIKYRHSFTGIQWIQWILNLCLQDVASSSNKVDEDIFSCIEESGMPMINIIAFITYYNELYDT